MSGHNFGADAPADANSDAPGQAGGLPPDGPQPQARSPAMAAVHSAAAQLHQSGAISRITMRQFDRACLSSHAIAPADVKAIRQANHVSQTVFARYLGTSESTVKQWESGAKRPSGMARTLLNAVRKHGLVVLS